MDVENMHPFCLPFGLCHDATSSAQQQQTSTSLETNNNNNNTGNSNSEKTAGNLDRLRCHTLSPGDDFLFKEARDEEPGADFMGGLVSPRAGGSLYSLECDINLEEADTGSLLFAGSEHLDELKEEHDELDNWYCSQFSSLFSPPLPGAAREAHLEIDCHRKRSLIRMAINNQVFHNLVDPLDIKSSPTLAQLNLNSSDEPADGLWAAGCLHNCTSISVRPAPSTTNTTTTINNNNTSAHNHNHHHHQHHHLHHGFAGPPNRATGSSDLLTSACCNSIAHHHHNHLLPSARHFHNHHHHDHHHPSLVGASSLCSHLHQGAHQHGPTPAYHHELQLTGLAPTPATCQTASAADGVGKKPNPPHQLSSPCCINNNNNNSSAPNQATAEHNSHPPTLSQAKNGPQLNQISPMANCNSWLLSMVNSAQANPKHSLAGQHQLRSASPALVTSSSSPLSWSEHKQVDNKLKENIDYLTALLCNGNKQLEAPTGSGAPQPPTISSTMVRSYATLAHSLSSSSKLLETSEYLQHQHQHQPPATTVSGAPVLAAQQQPLPALSETSELGPTNEASPQQETGNSQGTLKRCYQPSPQQQQQQHHQPHHQLQDQEQQEQQQKWFKSPFEVSVSAADSTDSLKKQQQHHQLCHGTMEDRQIAVEKQKQAEHKVLSSLLSANKCSSSVVTQLSDVTSQQQQQFITAPAEQWPQAQEAPAFTCGGAGLEQASTGDTGHGKLAPSDDGSFRCREPGAASESAHSIPAEGKPITLKPHANQNVIVQQRPLYQQTPPPPPPPPPSTGAPTLVHQQVACINELAPVAKKPRVAAPGPARATVSSKQLDCGASQASSHDEGFLSQVDQEEANGESDEDEELDSDDESFYGDYSNSDLIGASISDNADNKWTLNMGRTRRNGQKRYFWQYNVQSKGPKGARMCSADDFEDPFVLPEASDPVFSQDCQVEGVKHSGKARRGDGNDLTPNPRKLLMIGLELKKLGKIINELAPVTELPVQARNKTRKEKNKLASRACRLKKKAQHEANKIKLYGLQREHQQVVMAIYDVRKLLNEGLERLDQREPTNNGRAAPAHAQVSQGVARLAEQCSMTVAGQTSDYVNSVLEKVVSGFIDGGLQT